MIFKVALEEKGYSVNAFTDPIVALEHLLNNTNRYDLVITDYRMPNLNGCELGIKVKELNQNTRVILISAYDDIDDNILNFELLKKPITIPKLLHIVEASLSKNQNRSRNS